MIIRGKIGCKHDNMGHTHMHRGLFLGEYFLKLKKEIFKKIFKNI